MLFIEWKKIVDYIFINYIKNSMNIYIITCDYHLWFIDFINYTSSWLRYLSIVFTYLYVKTYKYVYILLSSSKNLIFLHPILTTPHNTPGIGFVFSSGTGTALKFSGSATLISTDLPILQKTIKEVWIFSICLKIGLI